MALFFTVTGAILVAVFVGFVDWRAGGIVAGLGMILVGLFNDFEGE